LAGVGQFWPGFGQFVSSCWSEGFDFWPVISLEKGFRTGFLNAKTQRREEGISKGLVTSSPLEMQNAECKVQNAPSAGAKGGLVTSSPTIKFQRAQYAVDACCFFYGEIDLRFSARTGLRADRDKCRKSGREVKKRPSNRWLALLLIITIRPRLLYRSQQRKTYGGGSEEGLEQGSKASAVVLLGP
jgi:hypothetical protein